MLKRIIIGRHIIDAPGIPLWEELILIRRENENPQFENSPVMAEVELVEVSINRGRVPELNFYEDLVLSEIRLMGWG